MAPTKRTPTQRESDLQETARLYLHGVFQADIAKKLKVSQAQISHDLKTIRGRWLASSIVDISQVKAKELAKIDEVERQAYRGWHRSLKDAETKVKSAKGIGNSVRTEAREESKGQAGDPRFLTIVVSCIDRRCKIFGLDAPTKLEVRDWRVDAQKEGVDVDSLFEDLVKAAMDRASEGRGVEGSTAPPETAAGPAAG